MDDAPISSSDLSSRISISESVINKALHGELGLTFAQIQKLGHFFGRTPLFYLQPGPVEQVQISTPEFRTLKNRLHDHSPQTKRIVELVERHRQLYIDLLDELSYSPRALFSPPPTEGMPPKEVASVARAWLGITTESAFDAYRKAIENCGVLVFRTNGYNGKWKIPESDPVIGFSLFHSQYPVVVVKKDPSEARQLFTLAHELGHILLFRESSIDGPESLVSHAGKERLANQFASHFLLPSSNLAQINCDSLPCDPSQLERELRPYRRMWGVSNDVILIRLIEENRLRQSIYDNFVKWRDENELNETSASAGSRAWRYREPLHIFGDSYVRTVLQALEEKKLTLVKASRYLDDLKLSALKQLESHCASH
jgi:Zn-dependent peptidase ImmA (M78 family)